MALEVAAQALEEAEPAMEGLPDARRPVCCAFVLFEWSIYRNVLMWAYSQARARRGRVPRHGKKKRPQTGSRSLIWQFAVSSMINMIR